MVVLVSVPAPIVLLPGVVVVVVLRSVVVPAPIVLLPGVVVVVVLRSVVAGPAPMVPLLDGEVVVEVLRSVVELPEAEGVVAVPELVPGVVVPLGEVPVVSAGGAPGEVDGEVCAITRPIETAAAPAIRPLSNLEVFIW
ncbi:MAG: hypothetical protein V4609_16055 [Pseudomonadota bacterium]